MNAEKEKPEWIIDLTDVSVAFAYSPIPGTEMAVATHKASPVPIGHIWFRHILIKHVEITHCWVYESARRQGVLTKMFNELLTWYPGNVFATARGNKMSEPWLIKMKFNKNSDGWFLHPIDAAMEAKS